MLVSKFDFNLPEELIAQFPLKERAASKMLVLDKNSSLIDDMFFNLYAYLEKGDVLVLNDTKVIPARLYGQKPTGGKLELLIERVLDEHTCLALIKAGKSLKPGAKFMFDAGYEIEILEKNQQIYTVKFLSPKSIYGILDHAGHMPLPPYIERADEVLDQSRYQTVYARKKGAMAAPTAGLHFDQKMLDRIKALGVEVTAITLHVGIGTFQPVRAKTTEKHKMHGEWFQVDEKTCNLINEARIRGNKVIAVGTTSLRALESAAKNGKLKPVSGMTDIFITPGFEFKAVDMLLTNFHLPQSTLLMLVSAFAGMDEIKTAYQHAIAQKYRFFSYGDAMLIFNKKPVSSKLS